MIVQETINLYRNLIEKIEKENLNPFELKIENLKPEDNLYVNGILLSIMVRLFKLKVEYLLSTQEKKEIVRNVFKQVLKEEIGLQDETIEELLKIESLREKLKKKKTKLPEKIRYEVKVREFLHKSIDYDEYAKNIKEQIEKGTFKINNIQDFIGLLFALQLYQLEIEDISQFLRKNTV
ncbi:MAG: hypothetical protein C0178_03690 [Sulfurihydrogenibium sp.]|nr:MAG: hypothetical protein C0178_03690 [Sulfurihydrogenibium sp.]